MTGLLPVGGTAVFDITQRLQIGGVVRFHGYGTLDMLQGSNLVAQSNASRAIESYSDEIAQMDQEKIDAAKEAAKMYNEQINNAVVLSTEQEEGISYLDLIDVGESIGFIDIPKIDVYLPIYNFPSRPM